MKQFIASFLGFTGIFTLAGIIWRSKGASFVKEDFAPPFLYHCLQKSCQRQRFCICGRIEMSVRQKRWRRN